MACFYNFFPVCNMTFPITYPHIAGEFALYERVRKKAAVAKISANIAPFISLHTEAFSRPMEEIKTPRISRGME